MSTGFTEPLVHSGTSTQKPYAYRSGMGMVPSAEWIVIFDDFLQAEQATENLVGWTSIGDAGTNTAADGNDHGGVIDVSSDAADEGMSFYGNLGVNLSGKKFFIEARMKGTDADDNQLVIGLTDLTSITNPEDFWTTQPDFIAFGTHVDADATPALIYDTNNGGPVTDTPSGTDFDLTDGTFSTLAISYNGATTASGNGVLSCYVDGQLAVQSGTQASIPDDLPLAPFFGMLLEDAASDILSIDYIRVVVER